MYEHNIYTITHKLVGIMIEVFDIDVIVQIIWNGIFWQGVSPPPSDESPSDKSSTASKPEDGEEPSSHFAYRKGRCSYQLHCDHYIIAVSKTRHRVIVIRCFVSEMEALESVSGQIQHFCTLIFKESRATGRIISLWQTTSCLMLSWTNGRQEKRYRLDTNH